MQTPAEHKSTCIPTHSGMWTRRGCSLLNLAKSPVNTFLPSLCGLLAAHLVQEVRIRNVNKECMLVEQVADQVCFPGEGRRYIHLRISCIDGDLVDTMRDTLVEVARSRELHAGCVQAPLLSSSSGKRRRQSDRHEVLPTPPMQVFQHHTPSAAGAASTSGRSIERPNSSKHRSGVAGSLETAMASHFQPYKLWAGPEERELWNLLDCGQQDELFHPPYKVFKAFLRCNFHLFFLLYHVSQSLAVEFSCWPAFAIQIQSRKVSHCRQVLIVQTCLQRASPKQ
jgi:hypothetical protein